MPDELIERATDSAIGFAIENFEEFADAVNQADDPFRLPRLLDAYAQRERIATVREYQARLDELYHDVGGVCRTPSEKRAFREMFPDSEL